MLLYETKPSGEPCCTSCCDDAEFCTSYECGAGFTKKPLRPDGDGDTELAVSLGGDGVMRGGEASASALVPLPLPLPLPLFVLVVFVVVLLVP